jgi:hypothetical protein
LKERIEACGAKGAPPSARDAAVTLAGRLVNAWKDAPEYGSYRNPARPDKRDGMLRLLVELGDAAVLEPFIADVVTRDYDGSENAALVPCARLLAAEKTGRLYSQLVCRHMRHFHAHCVELLRALASNRGTSTKPEWRDALSQIAQVAVVTLDEVGKKQGENEAAEWRVSEKSRPVNEALVATLLDVLGELDALELRAAAVEQFAERQAVFDPVTILVPALALIHQRARRGHAALGAQRRIPVAPQRASTRIAHELAAGRETFLLVRRLP